MLSNKKAVQQKAYHLSTTYVNKTFPIDNKVSLYWTEVSLVKEGNVKGMSKIAHLYYQNIPCRQRISVYWTLVG